MRAIEVIYIETTKLDSFTNILIYVCECLHACIHVCYNNNRKPDLRGQAIEGVEGEYELNEGKGKSGIILLQIRTFHKNTKV